MSYDWLFNISNIASSVCTLVCCLLPFIFQEYFLMKFFGHPQLNDDLLRQQLEKETREKHIEQLDEKIQQADMENKKVREQHK